MAKLLIRKDRKFLEVELGKMRGDWIQTDVVVDPLSLIHLGTELHKGDSTTDITDFYVDAILKARKLGADYVSVSEYPTSLLRHSSLEGTVTFYLKKQ